jgi:hypothetical protein
MKLLTGRFDLACSNLEKAHYVLQAAGIGALGPIGSTDQRFPKEINADTRLIRTDNCLLDSTTRRAGGLRGRQGSFGQ